jgi:prepilin-type N-terminal cleavage/methylation domain-containing protein
MKSVSSSSRCAAFTLIELLTVIAIIAVLMGLLFPAVGAVKDAARKTEAKNQLVQIVNAVKAFYAEYGRYPVKEGSTGDSEYAADNDTLFNVLRGYAFEGYQLGLNPRKIPFIEVPVAKDLNAPRSGQSGGVYYDPWGSPFRVLMDGDYDNKVKNPYSEGAGYPDIEAGVVAWSLGKDKQGGSGNKKDKTSSDDVLSWQ